MTTNQWNAFEKFRKEFINKTEEWNALANELIPLQKNAAEKDTPFYPIENPIVYNTALDEITPDSEIKVIVIGDNPGKNEQLSINRKYLVGQSGKIAESFFRKNKELNTNFRTNAIILNKTPVHTAKTNHLKYLIKNGNNEIQQLINESQKWMAEKTAELHINLKETELWLVGYAELKKNKLFSLYRDELKKSYEYSKEIWNKVYVYQHFSMNCFTKDLGKYMNTNPELSLKEALVQLGTIHKDEIFNFLSPQP